MAEWGLTMLKRTQPRTGANTCSRQSNALLRRATLEKHVLYASVTRAACRMLCPNEQATSASKG